MHFSCACWLNPCIHDRPAILERPKCPISLMSVTQHVVSGVYPLDRGACDRLHLAMLPNSCLRHFYPALPPFSFLVSPRLYWKSLGQHFSLGHSFASCLEAWSSSWTLFVLMISWRQFWHCGCAVAISPALDFPRLIARCFERDRRGLCERIVCIYN
jgi:hypothetical protein